MQRQLLLLAILVGCGEVENGAPDGGPGPGPDGPAPDGPAPDGPAPDGPVLTPNPDVLGGTLRAGCVVALHMEEASWSGATGEVKDDCGNDNPGTVVGTGTTTVDGGAHGRAGNFTGSACVDIPNAAALHATTGLTLSAWIFPTVLDGAKTHANGVISKRNDSGNQPEYSLSVWQRNNVWVDLDAENDRFRGERVIVKDEWAQLTMVYDGTLPEADRVRLYIDGVIDATQGETSASLTPYISPLHIGCMPAPTAEGGPTQQPFEGRIDEVAIWNRALSDTEIAQWYVNTKPR